MFLILHGVNNNVYRVNMANVDCYVKCSEKDKEACGNSVFFYAGSDNSIYVEETVDEIDNMINYATEHNIGVIGIDKAKRELAKKYRPDVDHNEF